MVNMCVFSNCDRFSRPLNSCHGCGNWISYCSDWTFSWVGFDVESCYFHVPLNDYMQAYCYYMLCSSVIEVLVVQLCWLLSLLENWCGIIFSCRAAISRLINLTETTIASGDDEGCIKVPFLSHFFSPFFGFCFCYIISIVAFLCLMHFVCKKI